MMAVRCLRSVASLTTAGSLRSRISTCLGKVAALLQQLRHADAGCPQLLAELAMGDLEAAHGRPSLFGIVCGGRAIFAFEPGEIGAGDTDFLIAGPPLGVGGGAGRVLRL